jgi:hypothetical protein
VKLRRIFTVLVPKRKVGVCLFIAAFVTAVLLLGAWRATPTVDDPIYNGKRLSVHLSNYPHVAPLMNVDNAIDVLIQRRTLAQLETDFDDLEFDSSPRMRGEGGKKMQKAISEAQRALLHYRERAFPVLLQMLSTPDNSNTSSTAQIMANNSKPRAQRAIIEALQELGLRPKGLYCPREQAIAAFMTLRMAECNLLTALPEIKRLTNHADKDVRDAAGYVIRHLAYIDGHLAKTNATPATNAIAGESIVAAAKKGAK